jgi:hypothetical protein
MEKLRFVVTGLALLTVGALFGGSLYDTMVLAPNLHGGPGGLEHGRLFMSAATPGNFFRVLSPASQILIFAALVANWRSPERRWPLLLALAALVAADVMTFTYHYPRNAIMFTAPLGVDPERLSAVAHEWQKANYFRIALVLVAWLGVSSALTRLSRQQSPTGAPRSR